MQSLNRSNKSNVGGDGPIYMPTHKSLIVSSQKSLPQGNLLLDLDNRGDSAMANSLGDCPPDLNDTKYYHHDD